MFLTNNRQPPHSISHTTQIQNYHNYRREGTFNLHFSSIKWSYQKKRLVRKCLLPLCCIVNAMQMLHCKQYNTDKTFSRKFVLLLIFFLSFKLLFSNTLVPVHDVIFLHIVATDICHYTVLIVFDGQVGPAHMCWVVLLITAKAVCIYSIIYL